MDLRKSRLISLFDTLSRQELRHFEKWMCSPFFNQKPTLTLLFKYLHQTIALEKVYPSKEDIFRQLFPAEDFDAQKVRWAMSQLSKQVEKYLVFLEYFSDATASKLKLAEAFRKRSLEKQFHSAIQEASSQLKKHPAQDAQFYKVAYDIQLEQYNFSSVGVRHISQNLQDIHDNFDTYFLATKLRHCCLTISHQNVYKTEYDFGLLPEVLQYVENRQLHTIPAIGVYYYCYLALANIEHESYFLQFKQMIFEHGQKFNTNELNGLYLLAINYCIRRLNQGKKHYAKEGLELYKAGLRSLALIQDGKISQFTYRNIIAMGLIVQDYTWVESFLHDYKSYLDKSHREQVFKFNLARLEYTRKNYDLALELLIQADFKDLLLNLSAKAMALKIYYELDEIRLLDAHLHSMKTFITRKKVMGYHRTNYLNLIKYMQKLIGLRPSDKLGAKAMREKIEAEKLISEREWLLKQLR